MTLKLLGLLPPTDRTPCWHLLRFITIGGALAITCLILVASMITDIVEDSERLTGRRSKDCSRRR